MEWLRDFLPTLDVLSNREQMSVLGNFCAIQPSPLGPVTSDWCCTFWWHANSCCMWQWKNSNRPWTGQGKVKCSLQAYRTLQDLRIDSKSKAFLSHQLLTQGMPECKNQNRQSVIIRYHKCQVFSTRLRHHKSNGWVTSIKRKRIYMTLSSALLLNMKQNLRQ